MGYTEFRVDGRRGVVGGSDEDGRVKAGL